MHEQNPARPRIFERHDRVWLPHARLIQPAQKHFVEWRRQADGLVHQHAHARHLKLGAHEGVVHPQVVVAVDTEHAARNAQLAEPDRQRGDMPVMQRDEVPAQQQDMRRECIDLPHDVIEQARIGQRPRMEVRGEGDPERLGERIAQR